VPGVAAIVSRFPQREFSIHWLCSQDKEFAAICTEYEEAANALRHWERVCGATSPKAEEYRRFVIELEEEISQHLDRFEKRTDASDL
jgi:hypothetical protein